MNFHANFLQLWSNKFSYCMDSFPQLNCLKADQFHTVNEQRIALEDAQVELSTSIDRLQTTLMQQQFICDYLRTCITKLSAVSRVFSAIDGGVENSGGDDLPSLHTDEHQASPNNEANKTATKALNLSVPSPSSVSSLSIPSSVMNSSTPIMSASSRNLLFHSTISSQAKLEPLSVKPEATLVTKNIPHTTMEEAMRCIVDDIAGLTSKSNCNHQQQQHHHHHYKADHHHLPSHHTQQQPRLSLGSEDFHNTTFDAARAAAAAVSAALGFSFPPADMFNLNPPPPSTTTTTLPKNSACISPDLQPSKNNVDDYASRPYRCTTCGRGFAVKAGLMQHLRTHTDERPYPCPECGRAFKQKIQLTTHMRVHSGERPYGCRICGKLFRQQSHVVQHLRTHTGEKPHKCARCNKAFRQKYSLISHQRRMCQSRSSSSSTLLAGMTMWIGPGGRTAEKAAAKAAAAAAAAAAAVVQQNGLRTSLPSNLPLIPSTISGSSSSCVQLSFPEQPPTSPDGALRADNASSCSPDSSHGGGSTSSLQQNSPHSKHSPSCGFNRSSSSTGRSFHETDYNMTNLPSSYLSPYHSGATDLRLNSGSSFQSRIEDTPTVAGV